MVEQLETAAWDKPQAARGKSLNDRVRVVVMVDKFEKAAVVQRMPDLNRKERNSVLGMTGRFLLMGKMNCYTTNPGIARLHFHKASAHSNQAMLNARADWAGPTARIGFLHWFALAMRSPSWRTGCLSAVARDRVFLAHDRWHDGCHFESLRG